MTDEQLRDTVLGVVSEIAPEADLTGIDPSEDLREQLDLDSMDVLNLAIGLYQQTGVEVPEVDYPRIVTLNGCIAYLADRLKAGSPKLR